MRIGFGYDLHPLVKGRPLILGGIEIPFEKGLDGHSDADVLCHSIADALLGAASIGDIGEHFPDTDTRYKDASSIELLRRVVEMVRNADYRIQCAADNTYTYRNSSGDLFFTQIQAKEENSAGERRITSYRLVILKIR